jgi:UDPglucose--hexose-1-phosphate uridylyltransferase
MSQTAKTPMSNEETPQSEIRKHYYLDRYVIIAPKRSQRPESFTSANPEPHKVANPNCPFCNNTEPSLFSLPNSKDWQVKVLTNMFSQLSFDNPKAYGTTEVVINTPDHDHEFSELSIARIEMIFEAYRARLKVLKATKGIRYVFVFKNDGPIAGASVAHAHCQIYALPLVPPRIVAESDAFNHYLAEKGTCAVCDVVKWEESKSVRIVYADEHIIALAPYASNHIYEVWFIPRRHISIFEDMTASESHSLAKYLKQIAAKLDEAKISFNYHIQEAIDGQDHHLILKLEPRRHKEYAGAEMGMDIITNPIMPEFAARWYKDLE